MKTIANVMMVLNEAEFIEAAIRSVLPGVDQLIVIDQGSTDGTCVILEELQEHEEKLTWVSTRGQNYLTRGEQFFRNLGIDLCFCDWLMVSDGDEIMSDGWGEIVRACINSPMWDKYGALNGRYWQMIGSSEYHSVDSPLQPAGGMRPLFFRMNPNLRAGNPMPGTKVHTPIVGIDPTLIGTLNIDLFHMGYAKSDMTARFERNIERGDWTQNDAEKLALMKRAVEDPLQFLWSCVPRTFPRERLPASIRESKWQVDYNPETKKIVGRSPFP